jgi:hypothetical protein
MKDYRHDVYRPRIRCVWEIRCASASSPRPTTRGPRRGHHAPHPPSQFAHDARLRPARRPGQGEPRRAAQALRYPWDTTPPVPAVSSPSPDDGPPKANRRDRLCSPTPDPRAGTTPDWLYHHSTISGPAADLEQFARGSSILPPSGTCLSAQSPSRILARQFRQRVEMRQARASELVGHSFGCPFDLHALGAGTCMRRLGDFEQRWPALRFFARATAGGPRGAGGKGRGVAVPHPDQLQRTAAPSAHPRARQQIDMSAISLPALVG